MKRLLVYFSVLVGCLFIGLTTYYMVKGYDEFVVYRGDGTAVEVSASADTFYMNAGETEKLTAVVNKKSDDTEILFAFDTEGVATYDLATGVLTAVKGGTTKLKLYTNKDSLGFYEFDIAVGDGSDNNGWIIKSEEDLKAIGSVREYPAGNAVWEFSDTYELHNDIELTGEWTPIAGNFVKVGSSVQLQYFSGKFIGNQHTIKNLTMTKDNYYAGLFGAVNEMAEITSLKLDNVNISGYYYYAGALVGLSEGAKIDRVQVTNAKITAKECTTLTKLNYIVSYDPATGRAETEVQDENNIGGIVGLNKAYISGSIISHSKISLSTFSGAISVQVTASVPTYYSIGGIVGYNLGGEIHNNKATVVYSIAEGIANNPDTAKCQVGGIIGTSYIHNPNANTFTENKDREVVYAIVMNNLAIVNYDNATARMGGVIGQVAYATPGIIIPSSIPVTDALKATVARMNTNIASRISGNFYYANGSTELTANYDNCNAKGLADLKKIETFKNANWSISTPDKAGEETPAWIIVEDETVAEVNLEGVNENHAYSLTVIELNQANFAEFVAKMMNNENRTAQKYWLSREYKLVEDIDLGALFATWTPIAYRENDPTFSGTFDGNGHTIKNMNIVNIKDVDTNELNYVAVGFFASVGTAGIVKNVKFENVKIDMANCGGAIAGLNYGLIENCQVVDIKIADSIKAGFVVGHNHGIIRTTKTVEVKQVEGEEAAEPVLQYTVLASTTNTNSIINKNKTNSIFLGGITGYNDGKIIGAKIESNFEITGETIVEGALLKMIGGIAGYNGGEIISSAVEAANIKDMSRVYTYIGGIAGLSNGLIEKCHAGLAGEGYSSIKIIAELNQANNMVGGIVGQLSIDATIKQSFVKADISAFYVGGIAANLFGNVQECYVLGTITGEYVGGIAVNVSLTDKQSKGGYVADCYVRANLVGNSNNSKVAGLSTYIIYPGKFERIIVAATFSGVGEKYFESYTDTRTGFYNFVNSFAGTKLGKVYNIIIDESLAKKEDKVIKNGGAINYEGQSVYYTDSTTIKSGESFFTDKGFSMTEGSIWYMPAGEDKYPELRNCNIDGNYQNSVAEVVEPVEPTPEPTPEPAPGTETPEPAPGTETPEPAPETGTVTE